MNTINENVAALRNAIAASRLLLYSGVNVAQISIPYADQAIRKRYTNASLRPPHWWSANAQWTLLECQVPVRYGSTMNTNSGIMSSPPVTYVSHTNGLIPSTLNSHTPTMHPIAMACGKPKCTAPIENHVFEASLGNH